MKVIFFDAAGTLFRVRGSVGQAYATIAARHGVVVTAEVIASRFRAAFQRMPPMCFPGVAEAETPRHERAWWRHVVTTAFAGLPFADFEQFFNDLFDSFAHAESWELFSDVIPTLSGLRSRGLRLGIVSNFDSRLTTICEGLEIAHFFDAVVMSGRVGCAKPDPRIFLIALERMGANRAEALHVGDSQTLDVQGAHAAGLRAILIDRQSQATDPAHRIGDLRKLLTLV
ncbi:MAG: HAD-IA family hydrolase [Candidatus Binatia bacterium]